MILKLEDLCFDALAKTIVNSREQIRLKYVKWHFYLLNNDRNASALTRLRTQNEIDHQLQVTCCVNQSFFQNCLFDFSKLNGNFGLLMSDKIVQIKFWWCVQRIFKKSVLTLCIKHSMFIETLNMRLISELNPLSQYGNVCLNVIILKIGPLKKMHLQTKHFQANKFTRELIVTDSSLLCLKVELNYDLAYNFDFEIFDIVFMKSFKHFDNYLISLYESEIIEMPNFIVPISHYFSLNEIKKSEMFSKRFLS